MKLIRFPISNCLIFLVVFFISCVNPQKLIDRGEYDSAVYKSVNKLSGKKNKKTKYVRALEEAFEKATKRDVREMELLKRENLEENWVEINRIARRVRNRQEAIEPLLPLIDKEGYKAEFKFVRVEEIELESKTKAADYYYNEGRRLLDQAASGDKNAAQGAYRNFDELKYFYKRYKDSDQLMERALELGTVYIQFDIKNHSNVLLPRNFEKEIRKMDVRDLQKKWQKVHTAPEPNRKYDYNILFFITTIEVSPEVVKEREYIDDKSIEEGWEYVLDKNGNVLKDSAGNDIKIPKKLLIKARVFETYQQKTAAVGGVLEFYDNYSQELVTSEPVTVEVNFENYAVTFTGDERALSDDSRKKIGNKPMRFPTNEAMILQAADLLKPIIKNKIKRTKLE